MDTVITPTAASAPLSIGLALSGGGSRAALFHLGVLRFLAEQEQIGEVKYISTVSGGSLAIALIYKENRYVWPTDAATFKAVHTRVVDLLSAHSLQTAYLRRLFLNPRNWLRFFNRANVLSDAIAGAWGIKGTLDELGKTPRWCINGTDMERHTRWHFLTTRDSYGTQGSLTYVSVGDTTPAPASVKNVRISDAVAASAAFPGGVTPFRMDLNNFEPLKSKYPKRTDQVHHIVDGGVLDNLGLESLVDIGSRTIQRSSECDFILVSDAGAPTQRLTRWPLFASLIGVSWSTISILREQARNLRARAFVGGVLAERYHGLFLTIGQSASEADARYYAKFKEQPPQEQDVDYLDNGMVDKVAHYGTSFRTPSPELLAAIERHGYEVAQKHWTLFGPKSKRYFMAVLPEQSAKLKSAVQPDQESMIRRSDDFGATASRL